MGYNTSIITKNKSTLIHIIKKYMSEPRSRAELQKFCKISSRDYFRKIILNPLIESQKVKPTIPDKPNSSKQRYVWNDNT